MLRMNTKNENDLRLVKGFQVQDFYSQLQVIETKEKSRKNIDGYTKSQKQATT